MNEQVDPVKVLKDAMEKTQGVWTLGTRRYCANVIFNEADGAVVRVFGIPLHQTLEEAEKYIPAAQGLANGKFIVAAHEHLPALLAELESARAVLARLPETHDGVRVTPDEPVYHLGADGLVHIIAWKDWYRHWIHITLCYSSEAAALAAQPHQEGAQSDE